jgi:hypothetical protein
MTSNLAWLTLSSTNADLLCINTINSRGSVERRQLMLADVTAHPKELRIVPTTVGGLPE